MPSQTNRTYQTLTDVVPDNIFVGSLAKVSAFSMGFARQGERANT